MTPLSQHNQHDLVLTGVSSACDRLRDVASHQSGSLAKLMAPSAALIALHFNSLQSLIPVKLFICEPY